MEIQKLTVDNFGSIRHFEVRLSPSVAAVSSPYAEELFCAMAVLLKNKAYPSVPVSWVRKDTRFAADVNIGGEEWTVIAAPNKYQLLTLKVFDLSGAERGNRYKRLINCCIEEDDASCFSHSSYAFQARLRHYLNEGKYYPNGTLFKLTDGFSSTRAFRAYLGDFINNF